MLGVVTLEKVEATRHAAGAQPARGVLNHVVQVVYGDEHLDQPILAGFATVAVEHGRNFVRPVYEMLLEFLQGTAALLLALTAPRRQVVAQISHRPRHFRRRAGLHLPKLLPRCRVYKW